LEKTKLKKSLKILFLDCRILIFFVFKVDKANLNGIKNEIYHLEKLQGKPNIIQLYGHDIHDSRHLFIILEYGELDFQVDYQI